MLSWQPTGQKCKCTHLDHVHRFEYPHGCPAVLETTDHHILVCGCNFYVPADAPVQKEEDNDLKELRRMLRLK